MFVHRRGDAEDDIGRAEPLFDQAGEFGEIGRNVVGPPGLAAGSRGGAEEVGNVTDVVRGFRIVIVVFLERQDLRDLDVVKVASLLRKGGQ